MLEVTETALRESENAVRNLFGNDRIFLYMKKYFPLLFILVILAACTPQETEEITSDCIFNLPLDVFCFSARPDTSYNELVITNEEEYAVYLDFCRMIMSDNRCDTVTAPEFDFDSMILLGKYSEGGGCSVDYERRVLLDPAQKTLRYEITVTYYGNCLMLITNMNRVLVPRPPDHYRVEIVLNEFYAYN